jgi:hypothetical protein
VLAGRFARTLGGGRIGTGVKVRQRQGADHRPHLRIEGA